jgi:hypothetical protein
VIDNIIKYQQLTSDTVNVTLRPAISSLSIGTFWTLLEFAVHNQMVIKPVLVTNPNFLDPRFLPDSIKKDYLPNYQKLISQLSHVDSTQSFNASDRHNCELIAQQWAQACIFILQDTKHNNLILMQSQLVKHCAKWDQVHGFNALNLYPEFVEIFSENNYVPG